MKLLANTIQLLEDFCQRIDSNIPFFHIRYNDAELEAMFGARAPNELTGGYDHHFSSVIGDTLMESYGRLSCQIRESHTPRNYIIGTFCHDANYGYVQVRDRFMALTRGLGIFNIVTWGPSDFWYSTLLENQQRHAGDALLKFFDLVRLRGNVVLVGNGRIKEGCHSLGASFIEIPGKDAYNHDARIRSTCFESAKAGTLFIWCAGLPGKVWSHAVYEMEKTTSHIDAGHFFDFAFGDLSRSWTERTHVNTVHREYYIKTVIPYIKSFIPK